MSPRTQQLIVNVHTSRWTWLFIVLLTILVRSDLSCSLLTSLRVCRLLLRQLLGCSYGLLNSSLLRKVVLMLSLLHILLDHGPEVITHCTSHTALSKELEEHLTDLELILMELFRLLDRVEFLKV